MSCERGMSWHEKRADSDCCLVVEGKRFYVEKDYLSTNSSYFNALFYGGFKETGQDEIELKEVDSKMFSLALDLMHKRTELTREMLMDVLPFACRFDIKCVLSEGEQMLLDSEDFEDLDERFLAGDQYGMTKVYEQCISDLSSEIGEKILDIRASPCWDKYSDKLKALFFDELLNENIACARYQEKLRIELQQANTKTHDVNGNIIDPSMTPRPNPAPPVHTGPIPNLAPPPIQHQPFEFVMLPPNQNQAPNQIPNPAPYRPPNGPPSKRQKRVFVLFPENRNQASNQVLYRDPNPFANPALYQAPNLMQNHGPNPHPPPFPHTVPCYHANQPHYQNHAQHLPHMFPLQQPYLQQLQLQQHQAMLQQYHSMQLQHPHPQLIHPPNPHVLHQQ
ncbi:hypothetical protein PFISCL1PPCAC_11001 [Pristionchus fissidentatus]|uniref:BTB domain-containing protein n=1 Tax=Pristionchus fissidentatus TaxID=1538716 RepID=A0AAV5VPJ6_9BILA|nr:hypothetical protein PFISCL1PPCAC_11001 [Pristionchus fissidentatus]